jgi:hypothetical protein
MGSMERCSGWRAFLRALPLALAIIASIAWTGLDGKAAGALTFSISGRVIDVVTQKPLAGARVSIVPNGPATLTAGDGRYRLQVGSGAYDMQASASGYVPVTLDDCRGDTNTGAAVDFQMIPTDLSAQDEALVYSRLVRSPSSTYDNEADSSKPLLTTPLSAMPTKIRVLHTATNQVETMDFEQYLRGVVPSEMPYSWPAQALRAQTVAARCYAAYAVAHPRHPEAGPDGADVCDSHPGQWYGHCQYWDHTYYGTTDAAVADTRGVVALYNGGVISAFFFSHCNNASTRNSEDALNWRTCVVSGWGYVPYCRARPCSGHERYPSSCGYYGHGVGMCQWGAKVKAESGKDYRTILSEFYTGISFSGSVGPAAPTLVSPVNGQLVQVGTRQTFRWNGVGDQYYVELTRASGGWSTISGWISATSWSMPMPTTAGTYNWRVKARTGGAEGNWSQTRKLILATAINEVHLPVVGKD